MGRVGEVSNHELAVVIEMQVVEHRASVVRLGTAVRPLSCCTSAPELDGRCYLRLPGRREGHSRWKAVGTALLYWRTASREIRADRRTGVSLWGALNCLGLRAAGACFAMDLFSTDDTV